jgi:hypothetical protein
MVDMAWCKCMGCGERMIGILDYKTKFWRKRCEECDGNSTDYNIDNPKPKSLQVEAGAMRSKKT